MDLVLSPYSSPISAIYRKGRKFIFSMLPPAEVYLEGLIDLAAAGPFNPERFGTACAR